MPSIFLHTSRPLYSTVVGCALAAGLWALGVWGQGCKSSDEGGTSSATQPAESAPAKVETPAPEQAAAASESPPTMKVERPKPNKPEIVPARGGGESIEPLVRAELARAERDGRDLIVYVGATWCEPCQRFKQALKSGLLNADFPTLRVLEFDLDRDRARLNSAGCTGRMIPLFARPDDTGRCSDIRFEGAVKGPEAIDVIKPRLARLIAKDTPR